MGVMVMVTVPNLLGVGCRVFLQGFYPFADLWEGVLDFVIITFYTFVLDYNPPLLTFVDGVFTIETVGVIIKKFWPPF